mgnify:CR=1 FL=1
MNTIVRDKASLKEYYEKTIKNMEENKENLFSDVSLVFTNEIESLVLKKKALDLGYGYGNYTLYLSSLGFNVDAIDIIDRKILINRANQCNLNEKMSIYQCKIENWKFENDYDVIVCKDVLHFLSKKNVKRIIEQCQKHTKPNGLNYIVIFSEINREDEFCNPIFIENEANFSTETFINLIENIYEGWAINFNISSYSEREKKNATKDYFSASRIEVIARKNI